FADGSGSGSGVVYDTDGNIITNNHVIEDAQSIQVTTADGNTYDAELVGTDASSDIAVIHADFGDAEVTPIEVGDSSELQVGDWVMSVGSPFGLENSVSQGIVSALSRNTLLESTSGNTLYTNLIQTDATINPGNSGGALVNSQGQLVGICTLYSSDTQSFAGIGYAIPSDYATEIADKVIAGETVTHAYIGLSMQTVNNQTAYQNNLAVSEGAYVVEVTEGSPADTAGIEAGDVITRIGDAQVTSADDAILAVRSHSIGETVQVTVVRGSQEMTFDVTLGSDESLQQEQQNQREDTVRINGQDISLQDLIDLYQQYQEQQYSPFGGR
ncbi:MAG TPA: trypsin-like peptidase domain-containing protein, partial [Candidatus Olsenella avistercoris]|nr:trypsin-like peptidase domain-containing protein [Candidatus Olsenella avistercoris]